MKKINTMLCSCILIPTAMAMPSSEYFFAGPPGLQVKSASLHLEQTNTIFANGRMQAPIRVHYELANGVELKSIKLKRMYYGDDINLHGWNVTTKDNGFDKIIGHSRAVQSLTLNTSQYTLLYVSADRQNKNSIANICLELITSLHGQERSYSTCSDNGIANGNVSIHAIPEINYGAHDFYLEFKSGISEGINEAIYHLTLKKHNSIPRDITFTVEEGVPHIAQETLWLDNSYATHNYWVKGTRVRSNISSYIAQKDNALTFNWSHSALNPRSAQFNIPKTDDPNTVFNVIVYYLHQFEFLSENNRCVQVNNSCNYNCVDQRTLNTFCKNSVNEQNKESQNILLLDNYGNEARFTFYLNPNTGEPDLE